MVIIYYINFFSYRTIYVLWVFWGNIFWHISEIKNCIICIFGGRVGWNFLHRYCLRWWGFREPIIALCQKSLRQDWDSCLYITAPPPLPLKVIYLTVSNIAGRVSYKPENWNVAPSRESTSEPTNPAKPATKTSGHCGGLSTNTSGRIHINSVR